MTSLASQALSVLATRRSTREPRSLEDFVHRLEQAAVDRDPARPRAVLAEMRAMRVANDRIVDEIIPAVARRLGESWCADDVGFADVTIGVARLQAMLRDLAPDDRADDGTSVPLLAVVVEAGEFHTLGAMILSSQLRRLGYAVRLFLGRSETELLDALATDRFDAVLVSAARSEQLVNLPDCVRNIRRAVTRATPIIVGGSAIARGLTIEGQLDADFITSDLFEALKVCGLKTSQDVAGRRKMTEATPSPKS